jgi:hypothetical protein
MKKLIPLTLTAFLMSSCCQLAQAQSPQNLVVDTSFESSQASWFNEAGGLSYFAAKNKIADAPDGSQVLEIRGWDLNGSVIPSPVLTLDSDTYTATIKVRSFGTTTGANLKLALVEAEGEKSLASFGDTPLDGKGAWSTLTGTQKITAGSKARLAIIVSGLQDGARVEVDQAGLVAGGTLGATTDNSEFIYWEAETMATDKSWVSQDHYAGWYVGLPSGMKMLNGSAGVGEADNKPAVKTVKIERAGKHRLWTHLMHTELQYSGTFTIVVKQDGQVVATREINDGDKELGPDYSWVWVPLDATLKAGDAIIELQRPAGEVSWIERKVDIFALTNQLEYKPQLSDFHSKGYLRFTNKSVGLEPFNLWMFVHRPGAPTAYVNPGILSKAGLSGSVYVSPDKSKWLGPGQSSPWVEVSQFLQSYGGRNLVQFTATRSMHTSGFVEGDIRGELEFAVGPEKRIVKTIAINQNAPRFLMTLPEDMQAHPEEILSGLDYVKRAQATLDVAKIPAFKTAQHLDLHAILAVGKSDDPNLLEAEIALLKRMGFNGTYTPVVDAKDASAFYQAHGMAQHFGMVTQSLHVKNGCDNQPDTEKMEAEYKALSESYAPILDRTERIKFADEPSGQPYAHYQSCEFCKNKFREDLRAVGLTPQRLGVASWNEVVPVLPEDAEKHPELFYYTGLFRLQSFADLLKAAVTAKNKFMPKKVASYVNYSPPLSVDLTWTQRGNDLFMTQRNGALELGWTEDWLGYGASPQQMSPIYAQLRAAGAPTNEPLGGYMVAVSGNADMLRMKYYEMIAGGLRHVNVYAYGPYYATVDSWGAKYDIFPTIANVQRELAKIDEPLFGTKRHKTDIAILYNRTAGIWMRNSSSSEQDARYIHWALAHAGYDADFIPEEDIMTGKLTNYKVLYMNGVQIRRDAAQKIADWTQRGGVLFGSAGAGTHDEFNRPLTTLETVFGAKSENLTLENDALRPKYELRTLPILDVLSSIPSSGAPQVSFNQLSYRETLVPAADTKVVLQNKAGAAAGVLHAFGKGQAIRLAASPGLTYVNDAIRDKTYDAETYLPKNYNPALRDFLAWPATLAKATRVAIASTPITEITRYDGQSNGKSRAVVFVIDHNATPNPNFSMTLPQAGNFTKASSASGKPVTIKKLGDSLQVSFALNTTDAIVLE